MTCGTEHKADVRSSEQVAESARISSASCWSSVADLCERDAARIERLVRLRDCVQRGTYYVPAEDVAEALLGYAEQRSQGRQGTLS
jgi:anti-sigma28 factor (negative regulator of flagellin synthesis)